MNPATPAPGERRLKVAFVIHDFDQNFGQGRYGLELARHLASRCEFVVYSNTFKAPDFPGVRWVHVPAWRWNVVTTVLSFLRGNVRGQVLMPSVEGVDYMVRCGVDPVRQLILLRSHLEDLRSSMEVARDSHSSVLLREAAGRLDQALALSQRIRIVLASVPLALTVRVKQSMRLDRYQIVVPS